MAQNIFFELSIVVAIAVFISILMRLIRQPLIISYIITGIIVGPLFLDFVHTSDALVAFSQMGIALLLFIVGLNLNFNTLKDVGLVSLITGIGQVLFTFIVGYIISTFLGFSSISAL